MQFINKHTFDFVIFETFYVHSEITNGSFAIKAK